MRNDEQRFCNMAEAARRHLADGTWPQVVAASVYPNPRAPRTSDEEYAGSLEGVDVEKLKTDLKNACNEIVQKGIETKVLFMPKEEMGSVCAFVPDYIPANKPARVVMHGDFGIPCGGTHVSNLRDIGKISVRKIKQDGENIRVSYSI